MAGTTDIVIRVPDWIMWLVVVAMMVSAVSNGIQAYLRLKLNRMARERNKVVGGMFNQGKF